MTGVCISFGGRSVGLFQTQNPFTEEIRQRTATVWRETEPIIVRVKRNWLLRYIPSVKLNMTFWTANHALAPVDLAYHWTRGKWNYLVIFQRLVNSAEYNFGWLKFCFVLLSIYLGILKNQSFFSHHQLLKHSYYSCAPLKWCTINWVAQLENNFKWPL